MVAAKSSLTSNGADGNADGGGRLTIILGVALVLVVVLGVFVVSRMAASNAAATERLLDAKGRVQQLDQDLVEANQEIRRLRDVLAREQTNLKGAGDDVRKLRAEVGQLKGERDKLQQHLAQEGDRHRQEKAKLTGHVTSRDKELAAVKLERIKLNQALKRYTDAESGLAAQLRRAQDDLRRERAAKVKLTKDLNGARAEVVAIRKALGTVQKQMVLLKAEFAAFTELYGPVPDPVEQDAPLIEATATEVADGDGYTWVTVSAGTRQKVKERMKFILYGGGKRSGEIRIVDVQPTSSVGVLTVKTATKAAKGHAATTKRRPE